METITHPYSPEFVQLFLPMVENEEITGSMRGEGDNDPVSEFIGNQLILLLFVSFLSKQIDAACTQDKKLFLFYLNYKQCSPCH